MNAEQESRAVSLVLRLSTMSRGPVGGLDDILKRAAIMIVESGEADCCSFVVIDADNSKATSGISVKRAGKRGKVEIVEGLLPSTVDLEDMPGLRKAIIEKTYVIQKSGEKDLSPAERKAMEFFGISLALYVPMIVENKAIGALNVGFEKENSEITENRLNIFSAMACGTALVYDKARLDMRLWNSEAEYRELFESSVDIMFKTDEYHMIEDINPQFTLSTGHNVSEWIGRPFGSLLTDYRSRSEINNAKACGRSFSGGEAVFKTAFGEKYFYISSWPRFDRKGNIIGNWHVAHDITRQKEKEKELIATKEKAEKASKAKSTFMANISHELRTPLTSIIGFGNLIMGNQKIPETVKAQSRIVVEQGKNLLNLINDILELADAERSTSPQGLNRVIIANSIRAVIEREKEHADKNNVALSYGLEPDLPNVIVTDELKITKVLAMLIDNAIKFTNPGGSVKVFVSSKKRTLVFEVSDTGIGIDEKDTHAIFERFHQLDDSSTREYEGAGMGLTLARLMVKGMGGAIWLESSLGKGSSFYFSIPLRVEGEGSDSNSA